MSRERSSTNELKFILESHGKETAQIKEAETRGSLSRKIRTVQNILKQ
jgi:hypothetical protein